MGSYLSAFEDNNQTSIALQQAFRYNNDYHVIDSIPFPQLENILLLHLKIWEHLLWGHQNLFIDKIIKN